MVQIYLWTCTGTFVLKTWLCVFVQVYSQLPLQKLSGYTYDVEDFEPYPCFPMPVPEPEIEPEPEPEPEIAAGVDPAARVTRSIYFGPPSQQSDVYSIFKVENWSFLLALTQTGRSSPVCLWKQLWYKVVFCFHSMFMDSISLSLSFCRKLESKFWPTLMWKNLITAMKSTLYFTMMVCFMVWPLCCPLIITLEQELTIFLEL